MSLSMNGRRIAGMRSLCPVGCGRSIELCVPPMSSWRPGHDVVMNSTHGGHRNAERQPGKPCVTSHNTSYSHEHTTAGI